MIDPRAIGKVIGSGNLMKVVVAACERPAIAVQAKVPAAAQVAKVIAAIAPAGVGPTVESAANMVLDKSCRRCHSPGQRNDRTFPMHDIGDMAIDTTADIPGDPEKSPLYASIALNRMPLGTKLTLAELDALKAWIVALGDMPIAAAVAAGPAVAASPKAAPAPLAPPTAAEIDLPRFVGGDFAQLSLAAGDGRM